MKFVAKSDTWQNRHFVIEPGESVGWYLYVFEGERCVQDFMQDSYKAAVQQALIKFGIAEASWEPAE